MDKPVRMRRKGERPGEILDAAFEEFVLKGYAAARLEDVAVRAGVTKGTIYFYFENKEQVFATMVRELSRPMVARAEEFLAESHYEVAHIGDFLKGYLKFFYEAVVADRRAAEILRLLIAEAGQFPELVDEHFRNFVTPMLTALRKALVAGGREGALRRSPVLEFPEILLAPALQLNIWMLVYSGRVPIDAARHLEATIDLLLHGLLPGRDRPAKPARPERTAKQQAEAPTDARRSPSRRSRMLANGGRA